MIAQPEWRPTNAEYHGAVGYWSASRLNELLKAPIEAFLRRSGDAPPRPRNESLVMGTLLNYRLLEPGRFNANTHISRVATTGAKEFGLDEESYPDRLVVTSKEAYASELMADAIRNPRSEHAEIAKGLMLTHPGVSEYAHRWTETTPTGFEIPCQSKSDRALEIVDDLVVVDLKSSRDPGIQAFARSVENYGYDLQAAHNKAALESALQRPVAAFYWVVVRSSWPWDVRVWDASLWLARGEARRQLALGRLEEMAPDTTGRLWWPPEERIVDQVVPQLPAPYNSGGLHVYE